LSFLLFVLAGDLALLLIAPLDWPRAQAMQRVLGFVLGFDGVSVALLTLLLIGGPLTRLRA
jgi:hypothetical protein